MKADIVDALRALHKNGIVGITDLSEYVSYGDAADEIERLRDVVRELLFCPGMLRAHDHRECEKTLIAQRKAVAALGEKE